MPDIIQTLGDFGGYALSVQRRNRKPEDNSLGVTSTPTVTALILTKGATAIEVAVSDDSYAGAGADLIKTGKTMLAAFSAIGAQVVLGDRSAPLPASGTTGATGPYTRSAPLTPGTPLPPGRGVLVKGAGSFALKLAGGGTMNVGDQTGGAGTKFDDVAVIDATLSKPIDTVAILY